MTSEPFFFPGDRVKYKNAQGIVKERGVNKGVRYIKVVFQVPVQFTKVFKGDDIKKLKRG